MTSRILVAAGVPGPPARAFRAFTEDVGTWWQDNPLFRFTPRGTGAMAFEPPADDQPGRFVERLPNGDSFLVGEISIWEPGVRLAFGWRQASFTAGQHTEVEVRFEAVGDETRVTVQHSGWDSVPQAHAARHGMPPLYFDRRHAGWWRAMLTGLGTQSG